MGFGRGRSILAALVLGLIALPVPAILTAAPAAAQVSNPVKILPIGDSITLGKGDGRSCTGGPNGTTCRIAGYRLPLQNSLAGAGRSFNFVGTKQSGPDFIDRDHEGNGGYLIGQMHETWEAAKTANPDIVLLHAGTNDVDDQYALSTAPQRLADLARVIRDQASVDHVIVAKVTPWRNGLASPPDQRCAPAPEGDQADQRTRDFNAAMEPLVSALGPKVSIVDMYSVINKSTDLADCVHPDLSGYDKMAGVWFNKIQALLAPSATAPGPPTNVDATAGNGQATVSFTAPSNGGSPITSYTVTASPGPATATGSASPITVSGLTNGTAYTFTVKAANSVGPGPASSQSSPVTPSGGTNPPNTTYLSSLTPTKTGDGAYFNDRNGNNTGKIRLSPPAVTYDHGIGVHKGISLTYPLSSQHTRFQSDVGIDELCTGSNGSWKFNVVLSGSSTPVFDSGKMTGATPTKRIDLNVAGKTSLKLVFERVGTTSCKYGAWADAKLLGGTAPAPTVPGSPTGVSAVAGDTRATVSFTAPNNGGSPITSYTVTSSPPGGIQQTTSSSPIVVTGLTNDTAYTFTVKANNIVGPGPESSASTPVTPTATPPPPPPPAGTAYLSELPATQSGAVKYARDVTPVTPSTKLKLNGVEYERGLAAIPKPTLSLRFDLTGRGFTRFLSDVGVDDKCGSGKLIFRVFLDGAALPAYESPEMLPSSTTRRVELDVTGKSTLVLEVHRPTAAAACDIGDWADAKLTSG